MLLTRPTPTSEAAPLADAEATHDQARTQEQTAQAEVTRLEALAAHAQDPHARLAARRALPDARDRAEAATLERLAAARTVAAAFVHAQRLHAETLRPEWVAEVRNMDAAFRAFAEAGTRLAIISAQNALPLNPHAFPPLVPLNASGEAYAMWHRQAAPYLGQSS
jgi:hypothetical protein